MTNISDRHWFQRPIRVIQTILRTCDAPGYDAGAFIDFAMRNNANAVVINGGGLRAFYPTRMSGQTSVSGMEGDILGEVTEQAAKAGLKVLARTDFRAGSPEMFAEHPEWFARDEDGEPRTVRGMYTAAATSPHRSEGFGFGVVNELLENYPLDGIWENAAGFFHVTPGKRPGYAGPPVDVFEKGADAADFALVDYSEYTAVRFRGATGYALPRAEDFDPEAYLAYLTWRYEMVRERTSAMRDLIKSYGHDLAYIAETPGILDPGWSRSTAQDIAQLAPFFDIVALPTFGITRGGFNSAMLPSPVWRSTEVAAHLRSAKPDTAPAIMFGRFDNLSRYTALAPADLDLWLNSGLAQGAGSWECTFVGRSDAEFHDRRADHVVAEHYRRIEALSPVIDGASAVADVAVVHSGRTEMLLSATDAHQDQYVKHVRGAITALLGAHVPFDILPDTALDTATGRYRVLLLPNLAVLTDEQVVVIRRYVEEGGAIVATGSPGLWAPSGIRAELPLADLLGVSDTGRTVGPLRHAFGHIETRGPLTEGLQGTDMITTEGRFRVVEALPGAEVPLSLVESIVPQPPELGWIDLEATQRQPFAVVHNHGKGRSVYFPGGIDSHVASSGHPDHSLLLTNAVRWASGRSEPVTAKAPVGVHISPLRSADGNRLVVSLVNYSSAPQRPVTEVIPVRDITVIVRAAALGGGEDCRSDWNVTDALTGAELPVEQAEGELHVRIDEIVSYRALLIERDGSA